MVGKKIQNLVRVRSWQEPTDFIFLSGWFANSENSSSCITMLKTLVLIGYCSSSIEINYHNKCHIMFFKLYVLCLFSVTKFVVLFNWPVALTSNRILVEKFFKNCQTLTIFGIQGDWNFYHYIHYWWSLELCFLSLYSQ